MGNKLHSATFVSIVWLSLLAAPAIVHGCGKCTDAQNAATLAALEKRLQQSDPITLEQLDEKAKKWFAKFQDGGVFYDGWKEISDDVVQQVPDNKKIEAKITMLALGYRIGREWSRDNDVRRISTSMLTAWGKKLRKAVAETPSRILVVINSIEVEVDSLLL